MAEQKETLVIARQPVTSGAFKSVGYHPESQTLAVEYASGGVYHIKNVPQDVVDSFLSAESMGRHFREFMRDKYGDYERIA